MTSFGDITNHVVEEARRTLAAYAAQPNLIRQQVGIEDEVLGGGYGHRQIHELIQNGADAIQEGGSPGRVHLLLTEEALYCANEGAPITTDGIDAILNSHMSTKRGSQIGQFGLGFKSVLAISRSPEFHCRTGSFAFDAAWSEQQIRQAASDVARTPVLSLARPLLSADDEVKALMMWATTVIKLPRNVHHTEWISSDIARFPREFLLFSPHVRLLTLEDRVTGVAAKITTTSRGNVVTISEGSQASEWTVFSKAVPTQSLGPDALLDADRKTRDRPTLPLLWAVPHEGRRRGLFWAFFPTTTETTLTGIVNAPWKTSADRQNLLPGEFNQALIGKLVDLVSDSLEALRRADDPGRILDILPARLADAADWADAALIRLLEPRLALIDCIADAGGAFRRPMSLLLRPEDVVDAGGEAFALAADSDQVIRWVHPSVETRERRAKAERLGVAEGEVVQWLEAIATPVTADRSIAAIHATGQLRAALPQSQEDVLRRAKVVLTASGEPVSFANPALFLPSTADTPEDTGVTVDAVVASEPRAREFLRTLGVPERTPSALLTRLLERHPVDWEATWRCARQMPAEEAASIMEKSAGRRRSEVRTLAGKFARIGMTLLPGKIVPASGERDADVCIDLVFHADDRDLLRLLGCTDMPIDGQSVDDTLWYRLYLQAWRVEFTRQLKGGVGKPNSDYLSFTKSEVPGPMDPLWLLSETGRVHMTAALLEHVLGEEPWQMAHVTRRVAYPTLDCTPPVTWMVQQRGLLPTTLGPQAVGAAVDPTLSAFAHVLPVATIDAAAASKLGLPATLEALSHRQLSAAFDQLLTVDDDIAIGNFYVAAAKAGVTQPERMACRRGRAVVADTPASVHVVCTREIAQLYRQIDVPFVVAPDRDGLRLLRDSWGMKDALGALQFTAISDEAPLSDAFPGLRRYLPPSVWETPVLPCERIWFATPSGVAGTSDIEFARIGERLCYVPSLAKRDLLIRIAWELGHELDDAAIQDALNYATREERVELLREVHAADGLDRKLALLVDCKTLFERLPSGVQAVLKQRDEHDSPNRIAAMALATFGVDVLREFAAVLEAMGLEPPSRWRGSPRAQEFVDELGFPVEYAGFPRRRRNPTLDVDGPIELKPLHDFQATISVRIQEFLRKPVPERGLLSLPTGSGKTRVVVQAVTELITRGEFSGTLVWIAQSDELCEQAVQSWAEVWRMMGTPGRLRISRLWGETNNRIVEFGSPHVVVGTYQSVVRRLDSPAYRWLRDARCVIIDEAHGSITKSYTEILDGFGITARTTERSLIGLTATPFRSAADPAETQWLVNRYGKQRFDHGVIPGDDPYPVLQNMGILARVDHEKLEGDELQLSPAEAEHWSQFNELPASAEARLGESATRNQRLIESIKALRTDWPVLVFAASVDQAYVLAALLSADGVSAHAISGGTDASVRRHYVEEFRRGRIRVLCNYNVLSTGFDAPALRALYIARPVFSPVLYQQMLGRGLRGPGNGGKPRCLIVNVEDNVAAFGGKLAFHHFEYLWRDQVQVTT